MVFDTNAYRDLAADARTAGVPVADAVGQLRREERRAGVAARGNPYVAVELLANLHPLNPARRNFSQCRDALAALVAHTAGPDGAPRFEEGVELELCRVLYGRVPRTLREQEKGVRAFARLVGTKPAAITADAAAFARDPASAPCSAQTLAKMAEMAHQTVAANERDFVTDVLVTVLGQPAGAVPQWSAVQRNPALRKQAVAWLSTEAAAAWFPGRLAGRIAHLVGRPVVNPATDARGSRRLRRHAATIRARYPLACTLYLEVLCRTLTEGANVSKPKHVNWVWDLFIAASASPKRRGLFGPRSPAILVATDGSIRGAARALGPASAVYAYEDYRRALAAGATAAGLPAPQGSGEVCLDRLHRL